MTCKLQIAVTYMSAERIALSNVQEAVQMSSVGYQGDEDDRQIAGSNENRDELAKEMAWDFHDAQSGDLRGVPALQAIQDLRTKYGKNEPDNLVAVKGNIEDRIPYV